MDLRKLKKLIDLVQESGISELEVTEGEEKVRIAKHSTAAQTVLAPAAAIAAPMAAAPAPAAAARSRGPAAAAKDTGTPTAATSPA